MSSIQILIEGAVRAAALLPLAFALEVAQPAQARIVEGAPPAPEAVPGAVRVLFDPQAANTPLTLTEHSVEVRIVNGRAYAFTTRVFRNDGEMPVDAQYTLPMPSALATAEETVMLADDEPATGSDGCGEDSHGCAKYAAFGEDAPGDASGVIRVAPGTELTVTTRQTVEVLSRGDRYRIVLPLLRAAEAAAPVFSGYVSIHAPAAIKTLGSATHEVELSGVGSRTAQLSAIGSDSGDEPFFAVEYELEGSDATS
jgi:hypothetical protein